MKLYVRVEWVCNFDTERVTMQVWGEYEGSERTESKQNDISISPRPETVNLVALPHKDMPDDEQLEAYIHHDHNSHAKHNFEAKENNCICVFSTVIPTLEAPSH